MWGSNCIMIGKLPLCLIFLDMAFEMISSLLEHFTQVEAFELVHFDVLGSLAIAKRIRYLGFLIPGLLLLNLIFSD